MALCSTICWCPPPHFIQCIVTQCKNNSTIQCLHISIRIQYSTTQVNITQSAEIILSYSHQIITPHRKSDLILFRCCIVLILLSDQYYQIHGHVHPSSTASMRAWKDSSVVEGPLLVWTLYFRSLVTTQQCCIMILLYLLFNTLPQMFNKYMVYYWIQFGIQVWDLDYLTVQSSSILNGDLSCSNELVNMVDLLNV